MEFFFGKVYGYRSFFWGICFNTSVTGYQEILTDPSYFKPLDCFPHIGWLEQIKDYETKIFASACIVNNNITNPLITDLKKVSKIVFNNKTCITDVDTNGKTIRETFVELFFPQGKLGIYQF